MWNKICIYWVLFIRVILVGDLERVLLNKCVGKFRKNFETIYVHYKFWSIIFNDYYIIVLNECHVWRGNQWNYSQ